MAIESPASASISFRFGFPLSSAFLFPHVRAREIETLPAGTRCPRSKIRRARARRVRMCVACNARVYVI